MSDLPFQEWYESDFSSDPFVMSLPTWPAQNAWRCVLQKMWANGGWLPIEDHEMARLLGCDVRSWRALKELLSPGLLAEVSEISGRSLAVYRQKRVNADWSKALERMAGRKARTAAATAERSRKSKQRTSVTVVKNRDRNDDRNGRVGEDRNVAYARAAPSPTLQPLKTGLEMVPPYPQSAPGEDEPSVARDLGLTPSGSQAASQPTQPTRMADDQDPLAPPGPHGQTAFLKKYAAYKAGDTHALDPHPEIPDNGINANPQLTAKIRQQLGLDYSHAEASPDTDDDGILRRPQQSPDPAGPETTPATTGNHQTLPAPTHPGTWHADPGNAGEEGSEMKWDDDDDDSNLFKNLF